MINKIIKELKPASQLSMDNTKKYIDNLTKPIGSLGKLEDIAIKISGIFGEQKKELKNKNTVIFCADNGIVEENVSCCPKEYTATVTDNFTRGITGINVLSKFYNSEITIIDIGIDAEMNNPLIINKKISFGTNNFLKEDAMPYKDAVKAIMVGIEIVKELKKNGSEIIGTGEMGIANTTTSVAVASVILDISSDLLVGKGAGLTDESFNNKKKIISDGIETRKPDKSDPIDVIAKVGGLDIAGLCGVFIGGAYYKIPIVIDGLISSVAALCAYKISSNCKDYMFASHLSAEPGAAMILEEIGLSPMLNLNMRLGEGTGCPLAFSIIDAALYSMRNMATMNNAKLDKNVYVDIRN